MHVDAFDARFEHFTSSYHDFREAFLKEWEICRKEQALANIRPLMRAICEVIVAQSGHSIRSGC